jgi:hypothetical protein
MVSLNDLKNLLHKFIYYKEKYEHNGTKCLNIDLETWLVVFNLN